MNKKTFGASTFVFPQPIFLVGVNIEGKPNFMTVAWGGMACGAPPMLTAAIRHQRYTMKGIKSGGSFSVNIPDEELVKEADLCGIVSGANADKVSACNFDIFTENWKARRLSGSVRSISSAKWYTFWISAAMRWWSAVSKKHMFPKVV